MLFDRLCKLKTMVVGQPHKNRAKCSLPGLFVCETLGLEFVGKQVRYRYPTKMDAEGGFSQRILLMRSHKPNSWR